MVVDCSTFERCKEENKVLDLRNRLKGCNFEGFILIRAKINDDEAFLVLNMLARKKFSNLRSWLMSGKIGWKICE